MKIKPFNLEEALNGAKVVTRDGRFVNQLIKFNADEKETLYGVVDKEIASWKDDGRWGEKDHHIDLFLAVEPKSIWVNIYRRHNYDDIYVGDTRFKSKQDAIKSVGKNDPDYIKTIQITDEL